jgi:anti-sigma factor RsiW
MACTEWENTGLLYTSGELSNDKRISFEQHIAQCDECREEARLYEQERARLYQPAILGELPSAAVDAEIMRVCGNARKPLTGFALVTSFISRPVAAVLFLAIGIGTGTYVAYHVDNARTMAASMPAVSAPESLSVALSDSAARREQAALAARDDSLVTDSMADTPLTNFPGNNAGVVPVDLNR